MNIQIIGTKKCNNTKKAIRFFKERNIPYYFVDLNERELSAGELSAITSRIPASELIDSESKIYKKKGYEYMDFDPLEEISENNLLIRTPVVRNGKLVTAGYDEKSWKEWIK